MPSFRSSALSPPKKIYKKPLDQNGERGYVYGMNIPQNIKTAMHALNRAGHECVLVGGCVRDSILGITPKDFDLATCATPVQIAQIFDTVLEIGIEHGVSFVVIDGETIEIATYRTESGYSDGRRPDSVEFTRDLQTDLARRDLTINAMAQHSDGTIVDPFGGKSDLDSGIIRTVGNPNDRFAEDGLRIMRAVRFAAKFGMQLASETKIAIATNADRLDSISNERIRDEFMKTLGTNNPRYGVELMLETGILEKIVPEMMPTVGMDQNHHHAYDVWGHSVAALDACESNDPLIRLACFLHDVGKPATIEGPEGARTFFGHEEVGMGIAEKIMRRMKFSRAEMARVLPLVRRHLVIYTRDWTDGAIRRLASKIPCLSELLVVRRADIIAHGRDPADGLALVDDLERRARSLDAPRGKITPPITGHEIMAALGCKPGPMVGRAIRAVQGALLEKPTLTKDEALAIVMKLQ